MFTKWLELSQHHHSGKLRPHEHTSYVPLMIVLAIAALPLLTYTVNAESPQPEPSSVSLTGVMPGKPPTIAATINAPYDQQHFTTSPSQVSGTCPQNTLVEIFKNDIFAGSTACSEAGVYNLDVDFLIGKNSLLVKVYDALNQPGPDSNIITVYYDALPLQADPLASLDFGGPQLLLNTDAIFRGIFPGQEMNVPISIIGGIAPFAVNIQWGDSSNKVVPRNDNVTFNAGHTFPKAGTYKINLQATDAAGRVAFLSVAAIVNGQPAAATNTTNNTVSTTTVSRLLVFWPLYIGAIAVVISFWIGERREKRILRIRGQLIAS